MAETETLPDHKQIQDSTECWAELQGWEELGSVMSNCDHEIRPGAEEKLRSGNFYGDYAGWNFHGQVWFYDGEFHCHVNCYRSHRATISAGSLRELMEECCNRFGAA